VTYDTMESAGGLWLVEPMHPYQNWAAGVPASGSTVPNIFASSAAALIGSANTDIDVTTAGLTGTQGKLERSGKGGLHAIYSNTHATNIATSASAYVRLRPKTEMKQYILTNWGHEFFLSTWVYTTRPAPASQQLNVISQIARQTSATSNYKMLIGQIGASATGGYSGLRSNSMITGGAGPRINNLSRLTYSATPPGSTTDMDVDAFTVGNAGVINSYSSAKQGVGSQILYRSFLEDMTVSGRTYAQLDALDLAEYNRQVLTAGGRYYGDTFTDPTTIP
jgi:hypothetical protein